MNRAFIWFVKITGFIPYVFYYRLKKYYVNKPKKRKDARILISNHTSVMDFPVYFYVYSNKIVRPLAAELLYEKNKFLKFMLKNIGAIKVNRDTFDFNFIEESINALNKGHDVLIFPESRIPTKKELLEFKPSFVEIAIEANVPIIPMYTNGSYKNKKRAKVMIGEEVDLTKLYDDKKTKKENIEYLTNYVRNIIIDLGERLYATEQKQEKDSTNM